MADEPDLHLKPEFEAKLKAAMESYFYMPKSKRVSFLNNDTLVYPQKLIKIVKEIRENLDSIYDIHGKINQIDKYLESLVIEKRDSVLALPKSPRSKEVDDIILAYMPVWLETEKKKLEQQIKKGSEQKHKHGVGWSATPAQRMDLFNALGESVIDLNGYEFSDFKMIFSDLILEKKIEFIWKAEKSLLVYLIQRLVEMQIIIQRGAMSRMERMGAFMHISDNLPIHGFKQLKQSYENNKGNKPTQSDKIDLILQEIWPD